MQEQPSNSQNEIHSFEEYQNIFLPDPKRDEFSKIASPRERGVQMAKDSLRRIEEALSKQNTI